MGNQTSKTLNNDGFVRKGCMISPQVKLQALNDSKLIGICIYNVAVLSILGGIIFFVVEDDLDLSYGFSSGLILCGTVLTSNTIFLPKVSPLTRCKPFIEFSPIVDVWSEKPGGSCWDCTGTHNSSSKRHHEHAITKDNAQPKHSDINLIINFSLL